MDLPVTFPGKDPFIFFDLGNVLFLFEHQIAWQQMAQLCELDPEIVRDAVFRSPLQLQYERGAISSAEFYQQFCQQLEVQPDYPQLMKAASDIFRPAVETIDVVKQLKREDYQLGLLSNTCAAHWEWIEGQAFSWIKDCFETFVLSFQVHCLKPELEIYVVAAEQARRQAQDLLLIDDLEENVTAARNAGWDAIQFVGVEDLSEQLKKRNFSLL